MNITQVQYVLAVAEQGNFSRAAERLFLTQPALSLQIINLEKELGVSLFERRPHGVRLTAEGEAFCKEAAPLLEHWRRLEGLFAGGGQTHLRVGIGSRALANGLFEQVVAFFDSRPEITVTFLTDIGEDVLGALAEGRMDLAVDRMPPRDMVRDAGRFSVFELTRERQHILLSPKDPRAKLPALPFRDMQGSAIVSGPEGSLDDMIMRRSCQEHGIRVSSVYRSDSIETVMSLIRSGKGFALGPRSFSDRFGVAAVPMVPEIYIAVNVVCLKRRDQDPRVLQLERYLREYCRRELPRNENKDLFC